ncbi:hypothetical protein [Streptomyces sp. col6]|uniref:hypothetical protein n=1 Tax=Streptomyces sp. col6 TaxID=2478958 RepID=UPI001747AEF3|nr:hypothetical protein [Streptomyces sp. col6]
MTGTNGMDDSGNETASLKDGGLHARHDPGPPTVAHRGCPFDNAISGYADDEAAWQVTSGAMQMCSAQPLKHPQELQRLLLLAVRAPWPLAGLTFHAPE